MTISRRGLVAASLFVPAIARAQGAYPTRPIRLVVSFLPGSAPDVNARQLAEGMASRLGQPMVIENRAGAGGNIGATYVARQAPPDGYTLLWGTGAMSVNSTLYARLDYDVLRDFTPITRTFSMSNTVVVHPQSGIETLDGLVERLRADPLTPFASGGFGSAAHLAVALFLSRSGTEAQHVPFRGAPEIVQNVLSRVVAFGMPQTQVALPLIRNGQLRALAVTTTERLPQLPDVPAVAETYPGFEWFSWMGLLGPAGLPDPVVRRLDAAAQEMLADTAFRERLAVDGTTFIPLGPAEFRAFLERDLERGREAVRISGARIE